MASVPYKPATLCASCFDKLSDVPSMRFQEPNIHQPTLQALYVAAEAGCPLCYWAWSELEAESIVPPSETVADLGKLPELTTEYQVLEKPGRYQSETELRGAPQKSRMLVTFSVRTADMHHLAVSSAVLFELGDACPNLWYSPSSSTGSDATLNLARKWLRNCLTCHPDCGLNISATVPTRLLQVRGADISSDAVILRELSGRHYDNEVQYLTLSHRWTPGRQEMLLKTTLDQFREGVATRRFKRAIQDAIHVTRFLGIDYLWVDTLCIMQDEPTSKANEIKSMAGVYSNAVCNLVACDAQSNDAGLFFERDASRVPGSHLLKMGDVMPRKHFITRPWHQVNRELTATPLFKRGWVLQELLLAPRILFFCEKQLHWQCITDEACESFPDGRPDYADTSYTVRDAMCPTIEESSSALAMRIVRQATTSAAQKKISGSAIWRRIVAHYSQCELTYLQDKLDALEGISSFWSGIHNSRLAYGLDLSQLPRNLVWQCRHISGPSDTVAVRIPAGQSVAPSWSWAAIHGAVDFIPEVVPTSDLVKLRGPLTVNSDSVLRLRGRVLTGRLLIRTKDNSTRDRALASPLFACEYTDVPHKQKADFGVFDDPKEFMSDEILFLAIIRSEEYHSTDGLLLRAVVSHSDDPAILRTKRLGYFRIRGARQKVFGGAEEHDVDIE